MKELFLIIHDVRSAHNVGSLFRTADGMGVSRVYLTGYTPAPIDRFGRDDARISKVSLGAEKILPWEQADITKLIPVLKEKGLAVCALEQTPNSVPLYTYTPLSNIALVVGNEVEGVSDTVLDAVDVVLEIPMSGEKESLNVSNAGAIALYTLREKLGQ